MKTWIRSSLLYLLVATVVMELGHGQVPVFHIYKNKEETKDMFEPKEVEILPKPPARLRWSAAFSSYHRSLVKRSNYQLHAFCHTSFIESGIQLVKFAFNPGFKGSDFSQNLILHGNTDSSHSWPKFGSKSITSSVTFNSSIGGSVVMKFDKDRLDMSGRLSCSVYFFNMVITSNVYDIIDIRGVVTNLASPRLIQGSKFYKKGASILRPVPDSEMTTLIKLSQLVSFGISWDISTEDITIATSHKYRVVEHLFSSVFSLGLDTAGQYFIDSVGNLHVNWESAKGRRLYNVLWQEGKYDQSFRKILMLTDSSHMIGKKFHAANKDFSNFQSGQVYTLPRRCVPVNSSQQLDVFTDNLDGVMQCGFLAKHSDMYSVLKVQWYYNDQILTYDTMAREYGIKLLDNEVGSTLDLRNVKIEATGKWKCQLTENDRPISGMEAVYHLRVMRIPGFGEFHRTTNSFLGKPLQLVYAMDGSTVSVNCTVTSYDKDGRAVKPELFVDGIDLNDMCGSTKDSWPKNRLICSKMKENIRTIEIPIMYEHLKKYTKTVQYIVGDLVAEDKDSRESMSHLLMCKAIGNYTNKHKTMEVTAESLTSINVVALPDSSKIIETPSNCTKVHENIPLCESSNYNVFKCVLDKSYEKSILKQGIMIRKTWKIGEYDQDAIKSPEDSNSVLKYIVISPDNNQLTIMRVISSDDVKALNDLKSLSCVIEFYYPSYITQADLQNHWVEGPGRPRDLDDPGIANYGPLFYSTDLDDTATHLRADFYLEPKEESKNMKIIIVISVLNVVLLVIIIVYAVYFRRALSGKYESSVATTSLDDDGEEDYEESDSISTESIASRKTSVYSILS